MTFQFAAQFRDHQANGFCPPVVWGMIFSAAAREARKSLHAGHPPVTGCRYRHEWSSSCDFYPETVMQGFGHRRKAVSVHDATETMVSLPSRVSSLTLKRWFSFHRQGRKSTPSSRQHKMRLRFLGGGIKACTFDNDSAPFAFHGIFLASFSA